MCVSGVGQPTRHTSACADPSGGCLRVVGFSARARSLSVADPSGGCAWLGARARAPKHRVSRFLFFSSGGGGREEGLGGTRKKKQDHSLAFAHRCSFNVVLLLKDKIYPFVSA